MVTVSIIEDDIQVAEGLKFTINYHEGLKTISVYNSCEEALKDLKFNMPDVILLDVYLPGKSGVESIPEIKKVCPAAEIIMLTSSDSDEHIFESLKAGAAGYLMKNSTASQIVDSIKAVTEGGAPMSNPVARKVLNSFKSETREYNFTKREKEILKHLVDGESIKSISEALFIESTTVKYHLSNIYKKLGVNTKAEAISKILKENIL